MKQHRIKAAFASLAALFLKKRKKNKKRWAGERRKFYIAADVHSCSEYCDFYWSKTFQCQSIPRMHIIVTKAI